MKYVFPNPGYARQNCVEFAHFILKISAGDNKFTKVTFVLKKSCAGQFLRISNAYHRVLDKTGLDNQGLTVLYNVSLNTSQC